MHELLNQGVGLLECARRLGWALNTVKRYARAATAEQLQQLPPLRPQGYRDLRRFAARWPGAEWAIEGACGLGAPLTTRLFADEIGAVDVPGHGRKNDAADAVSVAVAALTAAGLRAVAVDEAITALRALIEHRDDVVKIRTQTANRLHVLLTQLLPAGAPRQLSAEIAAQLLRTVRPAPPGRGCCDGWPPELIAEIRHLDRRIAAATGDITAAVAASNSTLTELCGIGDLTAGKILARVGDITRFPSARRSPPTPAPPRSRCPLVMSCVIDFLGPGTASSTSVCTSWRSPRSAATPPDEPITSANARLGRVTKKPCAV